MSEFGASDHAFDPSGTSHGCAVWYIKMESVYIRHNGPSKDRQLVAQLRIPSIIQTDFGESAEVLKLYAHGEVRQGSALVRFDTTSKNEQTCPNRPPITGRAVRSRYNRDSVAR